MPKSNYPDKLDTSVEIPVVRDNITEIGSDVLNSLRSAIFNIERTLGINPQGATGNTVSARLSNLIDDNGNILKEALDRSDILSGPIVNEDVSKAAAINESKLRLNYPTDLLQDQIAILDNRLEAFITTLHELNVVLSTHIHKDAINRHFAKAITSEAAASVGSPEATLSLGSGTLQEVLEELYASHMNYTGEALGSANNSHNANQIYYNNAETSDLIDSVSVQGAIDDLAATEGAGVRNSNLNFNSNGIIRTGSVHNAYEGNVVGKMLVPSGEISYSGPSEASTNRISFTTIPTPISAPRPFDILEILDSDNEDDNGEYIISYVSLGAGGGVEYVDIFGGPTNILASGVTAKITKNIYVNYNENGLNCSVRPRYLQSNTPDIQVALPNAATIISSGMKPTSLISGSVDTISIEIDGSAAEIVIFNSDFAVQSIDTVVLSINEYAVANKLSIFAYKIRSLRCYELAITHILPSFLEDSKSRTLKIIAPSGNDATYASGLSYLLDKEVEGAAGNSYHINGRILDDFGKVKKYGANTVSIGTGTMFINAVSTDFMAAGVRSGDLCVIDGSTDPDDDGTYRIQYVTSSSIYLDSVGSMMQGELSDTSAVYIVRCTAPIGELEFEDVDGLYLLDVFVDQDKDIFYRKRMTTLGHLKSGGFYAVVSDVSRGFIGHNDIFTLAVDASGMASIAEQPGGVFGEEVFVASTGSYKVFSVDRMAYIVLEVSATSLPLAPMEITLSGESEPPRSVLHLCRGVYSAKFGFILGSTANNPGAPTLVDKRSTGTVDDSIVGEALLERYIQGPRNELRASGTIHGVDVDSVTDPADGTFLCTITVNPGVAIANGVRFEYLGVNDLSYDYSAGNVGYNDTNNFYIALDGSGCIVIENELDKSGAGINYASPFLNQAVVYIAYVEIAGASTSVTDLRLFVDHIDYKLVGNITVANDQRFGHFTDIKAAVDYARMFSKMFPKMGAPSITIKEGTYEVSENISVEFDLTIRGSGPQTIIKRSFAPTTAVLNNENQANAIFLVGWNSASDTLYGVTMEDLTFVGTEGEAATAGGTFIMVRNNTVNNSDSAVFIFNRLKFIAASDYQVHSTSDLSLGDGPNQLPFHIGYGDAMGTYQNIIISNCYFDGVGYQKGLVYLNANNNYNNISLINNISVNSIDTGSGYSILRDGGGTSVLVNVQEVANMTVSI